MSSILGQCENNQQIFNSFVRSTLDDCEVEYIEQPIEALLERIESGEASVNVALNLIVAAHATFLLAFYCTPIEDSTWTNSLKALHSRMTSGLLKCRKILNASCFSSEPVEEGPGSSGGSFWNYAVPIECGIDPWEEFKGSWLLTPSKLKVDPFFRDISLWSPLDDQTLSFERELVEYSDITTLTSWHYFAVSNRISSLMEKLESPEFEEWMTAVDVCSLLMWRAKPLGEEDLSVIWEQPWSYGSEIKVAPTAAEHWAWQLGRVTALWSNRDNPDEITPTEYFDWYWPNGLTALSLMCTAKEPYDAILSSCWDGVIFTHGKHSSAGAYEEAADRLPTSHFFWLMRIGFLNGVKRIEERKHDVSTHLPEPEGSEVLLLGSSQELGKAIVAAQEDAEREWEAQIQGNLAERLGTVWEVLPEDSHYHLVEAERNLRARRHKDASLDYAIAVETVLAEWLRKPRGQHSWPDGLGDWMNNIRRMTLPRERRNGLDGVLRKHFDPRYASKVSEALEVFQKSRLPRAHAKHIPPFALKAKETALGNEQNPSVFELLLKFAKRWRE